MSNKKVLIRNLLTALFAFLGLGLFFVIFYVFDIKTNQSSLLVDEATSEVSTHILKNIVRLAGQVVEVDVVATPDEQAKGLSGRSGLMEGYGMLFLFEKPDFYGFWMKDMLFSIDIIWIDKDKKVVHMEKSVSPETYPKSFVPSALAKYVLEVPAGFSEKFKVKVGDVVEF